MAKRVLTSIREVKPPKPHQAGEKTILLVEDEPLILQLYASILRKMTEANIMTATEEQEALRIIVEVLPRLVLLDLMIPTREKRDQLYNFHEPVGFEVLRKIKSDPKTKHIHVIVITNLDADEHRRRAQELGAEDYLVKAMFQPREIAERVMRYLGEET